MKTILTLLLVTIASLNLYAQCSRVAVFGETEICLPKITGMIECYENPEIKAHADKFEFAGNSILGVYVKDEPYARADNIVEVFRTEYFKIYGVNSMKDNHYDQSDLSEAGDAIRSLFTSEKWESIKEEIEKNHDYVKMGKPVIIDEYKYKNALTFILIGKMSTESTDLLIAMAMDVVLIKDRLIWLAYYLKYDGEDSIPIVMAKNEEAVLALIEANK